MDPAQALSWGALVLASWYALGLTLSKLHCIINEWQTLTAGLLALGGALWTVKAIRDQIAQQDRAEEERRWRRHQAARTALPAALIVLSRYHKQALDMLGKIQALGADD